MGTCAWNNIENRLCKLLRVRNPRVYTRVQWARLEGRENRVLHQDSTLGFTTTLVVPCTREVLLVCSCPLFSDEPIN